MNVLYTCRSYSQIHVSHVTNVMWSFEPDLIKQWLPTEIDMCDVNICISWFSHVSHKCMICWWLCPVYVIIIVIVVICYALGRHELSTLAWLQFRFSTTIQLRRIVRACFHLMRFDLSKKMNMSIFRPSRIAFESNANPNFDHFRRSRMCRGRGIVVS